MSANDPVIVSISRTPLTRRVRPGKGDPPVTETLLASVITDAVSRVRLPRNVVQDVCVGNVLGGSAAAVTARVAVLKTLGYEVPVRTTNRQCSSGLQAIADISSAIKSGSIECGLAIGYENMSFNTMENSFGDGPDVEEEDVEDDGLDSITLSAVMTPMGQTSENVSQKYNITRSTQDKLSIKSHSKAILAWKERKFDYELIPNYIKPKTGYPDNGIRVDTSKITTLPPAFSETGTTTAGNSSQITDGAACVCLMSRRLAEERGLKVLATFLGYAVTGVPPRIMGIGEIKTVLFMSKSETRY